MVDGVVVVVFLDFAASVDELLGEEFVVVEDFLSSGMGFNPI